MGLGIRLSSLAGPRVRGRDLGGERIAVVTEAFILRIGFLGVPLKGSIGDTIRVQGLGALIIRIGFWGPLYYNYDKEPSKPYSNY